MTLPENGTPEIWDNVHPTFTVFNNHTETFVSPQIPYVPNLDIFTA